jgi:3-oxoacyl-[acyl-carrier-protein] synthase III
MASLYSKADRTTAIAICDGAAQLVIGGGDPFARMAACDYWTNGDQTHPAARLSGSACYAVAEVRGVRDQYTLMEAAALLRDGWSPGEPVVRR